MALSATRQPESLMAIVDMGSNGIRFSITNLGGATARLMPTLYQHRAGISLYDAQYQSGERVPIGESTISAVLSSLKHFKTICQDFGVPGYNITLLATEATRTAPNSAEFMRRIGAAVGWKVTLLPKEMEGEVGAMGIASSLPQVKGLMMDLGGGSTQLSWLIQRERSGFESAVPVSMPYGAAALTRRLSEAEKSGKVEELKTEIRSTIQEAYLGLKVPAEITRQPGGMKMYLSGGGFRGWGYLLMSQHRVKPYPIPIINGFKVSREEFLSIEQVKAAAAATLDNSDEENVFRVSDRRASQVPAVAFLVGILAGVLPQLESIQFCQGGVREGYLYKSLGGDTQGKIPLVVATQQFAVYPASSTEAIVRLLHHAIPDPGSQDGPDFPAAFTEEITLAFANLIYHHSDHPKDAQAAAALRSTTSGILAGVHGISHDSRALLALLLCARWGGPLAPNDEQFRAQLERLVGEPSTLWWVNYLGAVARVITTGVYPAGVVRDTDRLRFDARWTSGVLELRAAVSGAVDLAVFNEAVEDIVKVGKKKRWIGGKGGVGYKVVVKVTQT